jgi:hypothetical protein
MNLLQLLRCAAGKHHRDRRQVFHGPAQDYHSVCTGCGARMVRGAKGWTLDSAA